MSGWLIALTVVVGVPSWLSGVVVTPDQQETASARCGAVNGCRCERDAGHDGDHQCKHGYWL